MSFSVTSTSAPLRLLHSAEQKSANFSLGQSHENHNKLSIESNKAPRLGEAN